MGYWVTASVRYLTALKCWPGLLQNGTMIEPFTSSTTILTYKSIFDPLLKSPCSDPSTIVKLPSTFIYWGTISSDLYFSNHGNSLLSNTSSSVLGHPHCIQYCTYAVSGVQNIMTHLKYDHINGSFFIHSYTKTKIISLMQGLPNTLRPNT